MVRNVKSLSERFESEAQPRRRHSSSQPPDNIGISCTVQADSSKERFLPGRRRSLAIPRDNIGVACLPTVERLGNILEVPEYESSGDDVKKKSPRETSKNRRFTFPESTKMDLSKNDVTSNDQTTTTSTENDRIPIRNLRFNRGRSCKRQDTAGLLCHEPRKEWSKKCGEFKNTEYKFPGEMGFSNVRRPVDDPTKPRKPILPRDNIGFACRPLHKSTGRVSVPRLSTGVNLKSPSNGWERKNHIYPKPPTLTRNERTIGDQIKILRTVSKLSVLLLYMHFLLTYYLSFSKSHRYGEIFDGCPPNNVYE